MKRLPPSGYISAEESKRPGYLARRMVMYRKQVEDEQRKQQENVTQLKPKIKAKP